MTKEIPDLTSEEIEEYWKRVDKENGPHMAHMESPCWMWCGNRRRDGYGVFCQEKYGAHRVSWFLANGAQPGDLFVCHRCDNPACVRPDHLFLGTARDNLLDGVRKGRVHQVKLFLTEEIVEEIRSTPFDVPLKVLAEKYGCSVGHIHLVRFNKKWVSKDYVPQRKPRAYRKRSRSMVQRFLFQIDG